MTQLQSVYEGGNGEMRTFPPFFSSSSSSLLFLDDASVEINATIAFYYMLQLSVFLLTC